MINILLWFVSIAVGLTIISIVQRYTIMPIIYWTGAILDEFNCSVMDGDSWWFSSRNKTIKDFIYKRKNHTDGYEYYETIRWIPVIGILGQFAWFIMILLGTIGTWIILFIKYCIIYPIIYLQDVTKPTLRNVKNHLVKYCNIFKLNKLSNILSNWNKEVTQRFLNIKLHKR